jgi:hypothetical protein
VYVHDTKPSSPATEPVLEPPSSSVGVQLIFAVMARRVGRRMGEAKTETDAVKRRRRDVERMIDSED